MGIEDILEIETREADDMSAFAKETRRIQSGVFEYGAKEAGSGACPPLCALLPLEG